MRLFPWCLVIASTLTSHAFAQAADPNLYLEEVKGARAMEWVNAQNGRELRCISCGARRPSSFRASAWTGR